MKDQVLAVIPGDGVGPDVVTEALAVLAALDLPIELDVLDHVCAQTYARTGVALSDEDIARVRRADALLLGAVGAAPHDGGAYARGVLLRLRFELDLYVNLRPVRLLHERLSPLRDPARRAIDCQIVRENTEGLYVGVGGQVRAGSAHEVAIDAEVNTYLGVARVVDFALSIATRTACMVDKANAVRSGGDLWQRVWREARPAWPGLTLTHLYADVAAMRLVQDPTLFEVIVTNNSYGDLLSDLAAQIGGGLGSAPSASLNPETGFGLYEPVHGSAPDLAGRDVANPIGAILSTALLLERLRYGGPAEAVRRAVDTAVGAGRCTRDLGGELGTAAAGAAIRAEL